MVGTRQSKHSKLTSAVAVLVIALVVVSLFYVVLEADHDCCGEGCHICEIIMLCSEMVRKIGICALLLLYVLGVSRLSAVRFKSNHISVFAATPVAFRTRLNN